MTGTPRTATVIAKTDVLAYRLDKDSFQDILIKRPDIAEQISKVLATRLVKLQNLQQQIDKESIEKAIAEQQSNFLLQIRSFFSIN